MIPVFVNDRMVQVSPGSTIAQAAALADPAHGSALSEGRAYLTDGRGIRCPADAAATAGAIIRVVVSARRGEDADAQS